MRKLILILLAAFVFVQTAAAQNRTVTGKVTDEKGAPVEGVTVMSSDGKQGTQTDKDGKYSLSLPAGVRSLNFSNVNFETLTRTVGNQLVINVSLKPKNSQLEEVVVVGYGTQKRREVTGSLTSVKGAAVADKPVQSFDQALAGRSAGVQITVPSGVLNTPPVFRIRGVSSLSLSSSPLIVVDGTPVTTGDLAGSNAAGNALASINPADIESMDIAKDAAATAIYGSRAANGVVFITTKRGKAGKTKVNYNVSMGFTSVYGVPEVLNAQQYTDYKNYVASTSLGVNTTNPAGAGYVKYNLTAGPGGTVNTRWGDVIYRQGFNQDHNLNVSGGSDNTTYYFSAGYSNQEGILRNNDFTRKNILMNVDTRVSKYLSFGGKISYSNERNRVSSATGSLGDAFATGGFGRLALVNSPNISPYNNDGSYNLSTAGNFIGQQGNALSTGQVGFYNPVYLFDKNRSNSETNHIQSNVNIQIKPLNWLTFRSLYGVDYILVDNDIFRDALHGDGVTNSGDAFATLSKFKRWTWSNTLQIDKTFMDKHTFSLLGGLEQDRRTTNQFGLTRRVLTDPVYNVIQGGFTTDVNSGLGLGENYLQSAFGRFNYNYNRKYFISANVREDQYSALPGQKETFYGFSGAWEVSQEKFWGAPISKVFSSLKLRGSYGKVGNTAGIGDFVTYSTFGSNGVYGGLPILAFNQAGNPNLKWETSKKFDLAANIGFFKDRMNLEINYYKNNISGLFLGVEQETSTCVPNAVPQNVGKMYNKGIELTLSGNIVNTKNFTWTTNFNYTNNRNEITELAPGLTEILTGTGGLETVNRTAVGYSAGYIWVVRSGGADPATGRRILYNKTGNAILYRFGTLPAGEFTYQNIDGTRYNTQAGAANTINAAADAMMYANSIPKVTGGFSNTFRYKNFDLDILFTYQAGFSVYYGTHAGLFDQRFWNNSVDVLNGWRKPGDITDIPKPVYNDNVSNGSGLPMSFNVFKGDFIKLKNLTLGYNFPAEALKKVKITNVRFYVSGQNLYIFTKYPGPDPEVSSNGNGSIGQGVDRNTLANGRTMTVGLNIGF